MDEIFDRLKSSIKQIRYEKRYLVASLILVELIGIFTLVWFLRKPLALKFISEETKAYSIVVMNNNSRYVVNNGDFLVGQTIPSTKVVTLITPGKLKQSITADSKGQWRYQVPENLNPGKYQFTVGYYDSNNKLAFFKTYKIRSQSGNKLGRWFNQLRGSLNFPKKASAQESNSNGNNFYRIPKNYNLTISNLGSDSSNLQPGQTIYPQTIVSDQNGEWIPESENLSINYLIESENGDSMNLTPGEDCQGINTCSQKIPDNTPNGNYGLVATLNSEGQEVSRSTSVATGIGQPQSNPSAEKDEDSTKTTTDSSCIDEICSSQLNTGVVRLDQLYNLQPSYNDFGQAMNIAGDCQNCTQPSYVIENNYLQQDINLDNIPQDSSDLQNLISCLKETKNNPSSVLSLVASVASLKGAFENQAPLSENLDNTFSNFLAYSPMSCSLYNYSTNSLTELNDTLHWFKTTEYKTGASFGSLESFYQNNQYPILVETKFNQTNDIHYILILAITDNYIWFADSSDPTNRNLVLRTTKNEFASNFFTGNYWEILPANSQLSLKNSSTNLTNLPLARAFLRNGNNNEVFALATNEKGEVEGKTSINSINDKFYILGKYRADDYMYKIAFQDYEGNFILPIRETVIEEGNAINTNPASVNRNSFIGTRINPPFFYDHDSIEKRNDLFNLEFQDLNKLGVSKVRIAIEDLGEDHLSKIKPLIERAFNNGYFVLFQYKPGSRIPKGIEEVRLKSFLQYLRGLGGDSSNYAVELYNEPNLRHYWNDCRNQSLESDEDISKENPNAVGWTDDNGQRVYIRDCYEEEDYAEALAIAIKQASDIIWSFDPNIKLIIGALALQGSNPPEGVTIQEEHQRLLGIYLGEIKKHNDLSKFDFAIHGYQVWDSGPLTHNDGSDKGADGLLHSYNAYKNNPLIREAKGDECNCFWITEFSVDQLGYDAYNLIRILEHIKNTNDSDKSINSVFIHEFNGVTENHELWQLWDNGLKNPSYNLLQYYIYQQYINNPSL